MIGSGSWLTPKSLPVSFREERRTVDRESFLPLLDRMPLRILMNDGNSCMVEDRDCIMVDDIVAHVLHRTGDGKLRTMYLPLVTMSGVEPTSELAQ